MNENMKKFYSMEQNDRKATITIYGDITSWPHLSSDVSAYLLSKQIEGLDVDEIDVHISSYGGEVSEGWAIHNNLKHHKAKVHTFADGFVCSIASVIFMAGDVRTMAKASLLMIHQPSGYCGGTAEDMRKEAETLDTIGQLSAGVYQNHVNIAADELKEMLDNETWITPDDAVEMGFATDIEEGQTAAVASQSAFESMARRLTQEPTSAVTLDAIEGVVMKCLQKTAASAPEPEPKPEPEPEPIEPAVNLKQFLNAL